MYIRALLHLIQFISIFGVLFTESLYFVWALALSTVAMFIEILLDRGEKVATPTETVRTNEELKLLDKISRK